jgi:adenosylcobinamide amidohydrolase
MRLPFTLACEPPFLILQFGARQNTLSWSITRPGFAAARQIVWLEVRNKDLPHDVDPISLLRENLHARDLDEAVAFMTSRDIRRFHVAQSRVGEATATCVATVGLSNGEHVGKRRGEAAERVGTINAFVHVSKPLTAGAFVESISIASEARTAAILATGELRTTPPMTGTGTDCLVIAAPEGDNPERYAGLHTEQGEAIGAAVYAAIEEGAKTWSRDVAVGLRAPVPERAFGLE